MSIATIAKVSNIFKEQGGWTAIFLTDKGLVVKHYEIIENFFKEYERGYVKYQKREEKI